LTPLLHAVARNENPEVVRSLIRLGADVNAKTHEGVSVLESAVNEAKNIDKLEMLVNAGARFPRGKGLADSALLLAVSSERIDLVKQLIALKADVNVRDELQQTPLFEAAQFHADPTILQLLLKAGAKVNLRDHSNMTPLMWAASSSPNPTTIKILAEAGAEINAVDHFGMTPLMYASWKKKDAAAVKALLEVGARLETIDTHGRTALICAAQNSESPEVVEALVAAGANIELRDSQFGKTAYEYAIENEFLKDTATIDLLKAKSR